MRHNKKDHSTLISVSFTQKPNKMNKQSDEFSDKLVCLLLRAMVRWCDVDVNELAVRLAQTIRVAGG